MTRNCGTYHQTYAYVKLCTGGIIYSNAGMAQREWLLKARNFYPNCLFPTLVAIAESVARRHVS